MGLAAEVSMTIRLANREFTPTPGIEPGLVERLGPGGSYPVHGLVQLASIPTAADRARLFAAGISLSTFLGGTTYLVSLAEDVRFEAVVELVRWAGLLRVEDKLEPALWRGDVEDWARTPEGHVRALVTFHPDVVPATVADVKARYPANWRYLEGVSSWAAELRFESIKRLADEEAVMWIEQGPHPSMPLVPR